MRSSLLSLTDWGTKVAEKHYWSTHLWAEKTVSAIVWSAAEIAVTLICIGIPVCRPLYKRICQKLTSNDAGSSTNPPSAVVLAVRTVGGRVVVRHPRQWCSALAGWLIINFGKEKKGYEDYLVGGVVLTPPPLFWRGGIKIRRYVQIACLTTNVRIYFNIIILFNLIKKYYYIAKY